MVQGDAMNFLSNLRRELKRWQNRRARAKRVTYTWDRWQHQRALQNTQRRLWTP